MLIESLLYGLLSGGIISLIIGVIILAVFTVLMPIFIFQIRNILKDINKKIK